jgi:hypothetical protein
MADEKNLLPLIGLDQAGIIKDVPGHILPQTAFTDGKNILFKNSSVQKRKGTIKAVDDVSAIVATVVSTSGNKITFNVDPALTVNSEFEIANAIPSEFNGTYNVTSVSEDNKTVTVSQTLTPYTSSGTYSFTPKIDFVDYWPAPNNPQYIEVQQNDAASPAAPVFNSIRAGGIRERIALKSYEVKGITQSLTPTITFEGDPFNLTSYDLNGTLVVKPAVEREIKAGETLKVFNANPAVYDGSYIVTSITYNTGTGETEILCSSDSVNTLLLNVYTTDSADLRRDTFSPTSYLGITSQDWQSTFFAGGYAYVINDGYHTPHYLLASLGSNYVTPQLTPLPGWDWQRYLGEEVHVSCKVIRGFKDTLIAGNLNLYPITNGEPSLNPSNSKPGTIRISRTAAPGEVPTSWQPDLTEAFVEERELSTTSGIMDIVPLQGSAIVYTTNSIHSIKYDSRGNVSDELIADGYGALETGCVLEFDGKHIVIGSDDIYMFGGHPGSIQSICDGKIRDYFYNNLSPTPSYLDNIFMIRDTSLDEIHIYYPTKLSTNGFCNEYLAWNYRNNTWTINECNDLVSGFLGPVRGGGVAGGTVTFSGVGNLASSSRSDQQSITVDLDADYTIIGGNEVQTLDYSAVNTTAASTYTEEKLNILIPSEIIPFNEEIVEFNFDNSFDSGASSRDIGTQTGSTSGVGTYSDIGDTEIDLVVSDVTTSYPSEFISFFNPESSVYPRYNFSSFNTIYEDQVPYVPNSVTVGYVTFENENEDGVIRTSPSFVEAKASRDSSFLYIFAEDVVYADSSGSVLANPPDRVFVFRQYDGSGVAELITSSSGTMGFRDGDFMEVVATSVPSVKYELTNIPTGSDIDFVVDNQTLTESSPSHIFVNETNTSRSWSMTGTVPTVSHSSTTNANGYLIAGSGTTSPTNISGFTGLNLVENINQDIPVGTNVARTSGWVAVDEATSDIDFSGFGSTNTYSSIGGTVNNQTLQTAISEEPWAVAPGQNVVVFDNVGYYLIRSFNSLQFGLLGNERFALYEVTRAGIFYPDFYGGESTNPDDANYKILGEISYINNNISSRNAFSFDTTEGSSVDAIYTLTNGSTVNVGEVTLSIGTETITDVSFAPNDTLTLNFEEVSAKNWSVILGTASQFALSGDNAFPDLPTQSFPANIGAATAVSYASNIINGSNTILRSQPKSSDNTILQVFYPNSDVSGANTNITLTLTQNDGSNVISDGVTPVDGVATSTGTRIAQGQFFTQYRIVIEDNETNEIINITPTFNATNINLSGAQNTFAAEVGEYFRDEIISAVNSSGFMTNEPDWYDNGSSGSSGSNYVIRIGTEDIENYSVTLTNINTTNASYPGASSGTNNTFSFADTLSSDGPNTPDTLVVKSPTNTTITSLTTRSGESIESIMSRVASAIQTDTNDGWGASHNASNDTVTFTATAPGRYPLNYSNGAPADLVYTDYAVIKFDYTQGTNVSSAGNIPDINAVITTQGADESVKLTLVDPSRDNLTLNGPYEDTFEAGGATNEDIANSIKNRIDSVWANWSASVVDTGVAASGTATGNQWRVNLTSTTNDWILKNRTSSDITLNDVIYPADRAVYIKKVEYGSGVTGNTLSAVAGTNFNADTNVSTNFIPADIQIGHPTINPTSITARVEYASSVVSQLVTLPSEGNSNSMATELASILNSSAVPALSATSAGSTLTITTNDLTQQINNITFLFDEQTTQNERNSVSRTNGNDIAGSGAIPSTTLALDTVTDSDRPYPANSFNLNKFYPIVASQTSIVCEGIGYAFNADPPNNVVGASYDSYVERVQLPIDNSVEYKKAISYIQLLVEDGNVKVKISGTDAPGKQTNLYVDHNGDSVNFKEFDYDDDYKLDFRTNGRVINYYIKDGSDYLVTDSEYKGWRVSGVGFKVEPAESRGKR